jgi:hypothetical protein
MGQYWDAMLKAPRQIARRDADTPDCFIDANLSRQRQNLSEVNVAGFLIAAVQSKVLAFSWTYPLDAPHGKLMEIATAVTLSGMIFNVMGGALAILLSMPSFDLEPDVNIRHNHNPRQLTERKKKLIHLLNLTPHFMIAYGGACFLFSLNVSTWVLQNAVTFLAATITAAVFSIPVIAHVLLHL